MHRDLGLLIREHTGIRFGFGIGIGPRFARAHPKRDQALNQFDACRNAINHRNPELCAQPRRQIRHSGAAQYNRIRAIFRQSLLRLHPHLFPRRRRLPDFPLFTFDISSASSAYSINNLSQAELASLAGMTQPFDKPFE